MGIIPPAAEEIRSSKSPFVFWIAKRWNGLSAPSPGPPQPGRSIAPQRAWKHSPVCPTPMIRH